MVPSRSTTEQTRRSIDYKSVHHGAMVLTEGLYAAVRNPIAHEADSDLSEQEALEQLAAFSVLARWVECTTVLQDP